MHAPLSPGLSIRCRAQTAKREWPTFLTSPSHNCPGQCFGAHPLRSLFTLQKRTLHAHRDSASCPRPRMRHLEPCRPRPATVVLLWLERHVALSSAPRARPAPWTRLGLGLSPGCCAERLSSGCPTGLFLAVSWIPLLLITSPLHSAPGLGNPSAAGRATQDKAIPGQERVPSRVSQRQASGEWLCSRPSWHLGPGRLGSGRGAGRACLLAKTPAQNT